MRQEIRFVSSGDGTRIAWARHGHGPPLVRVATWLTNLETDWTSPIWRHWLTDLGDRFTVIRYDDRGSGLSDRYPAEISFERWIDDLEAVIDSSGFPQVTLLGMSQAGAVAVAYAARKPTRLRHLVLYGAYSRGAVKRNPSPEALEEMELIFQLTRIGWGRANPAFARLFNDGLIPNATEPQMRWLDDLQRNSTDGETALKMSRARSGIDVSEAARSITVPTLILHAHGDEAVPFEEGRRLATLIPGARFVPLDGRNHILLADEPAWPQFLAELTSFTGSRRAPQVIDGLIEQLTARELEVLRFAAEGKSNDEIAAELVLSVRTVERHLGNVYTKLALSGKSARAAAVARFTRLEV
jgi:pimeloyl-ACP methyl ester carboxylesterase/DNA-binding CsgD family transcriptional regulator